MLRKISFSSYILFSLFVPDRQENLLQIVYTGGMNIADYYINGLPKIGTWRDMHMRIEGDAVKLDDFDSLFTYFLEVFLFKGLVVRPVSESVKHSSYNKVKLLKSGREKFIDLFEAIREAKHHVHLEYFIFKGLVVRPVSESVKHSSYFNTFFHFFG